MASRLAALCVLLGLGFARPAAAWTPGPRELERCWADNGIAARGEIRKLELVGRRTGGWVLARAHLRVGRAWVRRNAPSRHHQLVKQAELTFYFWARTDSQLTIPHELTIGRRILVFLSDDLSPIRGVAPTPRGTQLMLQFAKANHRGYLFEIIEDRTPYIRDPMFPRDSTLERSLVVTDTLLGRW
jgi:hypothetical protein